MAIARALVHPPGRDREAIARNAATAGLHVEFDGEDESVDVYPEHWESMQVASAMMTQMNVGMGGVIGWRFEALPTVFRLLAIPLPVQRAIFDDLRSLERMIVGALQERAQ